MDDWEYSSRIITEADRNKECPITMEEINIDQLYCNCAQCNYNISYNALEKIYTAKDIILCPMCRTNWTNTVIYVNGNNIPYKTPIEENKFTKQNARDEHDKLINLYEYIKKRCRPVCTSVAWAYVWDAPGL